MNFLKKDQPASKPIEKPFSASKRDFLKTSGLVLLGTFTGLTAGAFASAKLYGQQDTKKLDVIILGDGTITVYNYPMRDGSIMPSGTEQNVEVMKKLGARGGESMDDSRRVVSKEKTDEGEERIRIKTYVKFKGLDKLLVLVDQGGYFDLAVAPASDWPKDAPKK